MGEVSRFAASLYLIRRGTSTFVILNTIYWAIYFVAALLGAESRFPLGKQIMRWEGRERVHFIAPKLGLSAPDGTRLYSPAKAMNLLIPESVHSWAFQVSVDGEYAIGLEPSGYPMMVFPRVSLFDEDGRFLKDNSESPVDWSFFSPSPLFPSLFDKPVAKLRSQQKLVNRHGPGFNSKLESGRTYIVQIRPSANQDYYHRIEGGSGDPEYRFNRYNLRIRKYGTRHPKGSVAGFLLVTPILLLLILNLAIMLYRERVRRLI